MSEYTDEQGNKGVVSLYKVYFYWHEMRNLNVLATNIPDAYKKARVYLKKDIENIYEVKHICTIDCK